MHKIKEKLMEELYLYEDKAEKNTNARLSDTEINRIHMLTDTVKNIDKIQMLEQDSGYSEDGGWMARGIYDDGMSYENGSSFARGRGRNAKRDNMGRYSRDGGYSEDGGSSYARGGQADGNRGGYSRDDGKEHMLDKLEDMMEEAESDKEREVLRRCASQLKNM